MSDILELNDKIKSFNKIIKVSGDKSLSIRWVLFASIANGISKSHNLLKSEDVLTAINIIKKLGIKVIQRKNVCIIYGKGLSGYKTNKKITLNSGNSGTVGRLILGLLIDTQQHIKLIGDKSLSRRDFKRITDPLKKFGAAFKITGKKYLPITIKGTKNLKPINYLEKKGSAQCKSSVILAALKTKGVTSIKAKKSRNHTELMCKYLKLPIKIRSRKNFDIIKVSQTKKIKPFSYNIPSDISSASFFIILTVLTNSSSITLKDVNINPSRTGVIKILNLMGIKVIFKNKRIYKGELIADIKVKTPKKIKAINCPVNLNSGAIDEFLIIFLIAAKAKGVSYFKNLEELNQKESPRLKWGAKILRKMGIKTVLTKSSIKIFGNPHLDINKKIIIKNYLKDHRVFMTCVIAALSFGGKWRIHNKNCFKTSFPNFLNLIKEIKK